MKFLSVRPLSQWWPTRCCCLSHLRSVSWNRARVRAFHVGSSSLRQVVIWDRKRIFLECDWRQRVTWEKKGRSYLDLLASSLAWLAKHMMCSQRARRNLKSFQRINNLTIKPLYDYTYHSEWDAWIMYNVFKSKILREVSYHFKIGSYF